MHTYSISLLLVGACYGHTISFTGVATEMGTAAAIPTNYFGVNAVGQEFTAEINFIDSVWDGQSIMRLVVEYPATPVADVFDSGHGVVYAARVGPTVGAAVNWIIADFDAAGLVDFNGGNDWAGWDWRRNWGINCGTVLGLDVHCTGGTFGQATHQSSPGFSNMVNVGVLGPVFLDGIIQSAVPEPAPSVLILLGLIALIATGARSLSR